MCSNMNAIFVISATIYCIGFIISSHYCLGSQNLIEFIEEWGCYDSEIRLTCGHLDSKIAILEATFSPNCTEEECIKGDLKRLMRGHPRSKVAGFTSAETEAGQRFLETLRKSDLNSNAELVDVESENVENVEPVPQPNYLVGVKEKRASLRASLERLIVKYLRQISPSENFQEFGKQLKRYRRNLLSLSETQSEEIGYDSKPDRVMIGARNVSFDDYEMQDRAASSEDRYRKFYENRAFCADQKRKIGALQRLQIDETLRKPNDTRQNIRKILNKRCSGKNHCSFLFAADDPLAVLWDSGLVHIKYVCMDGYHTNRYCNEHLTIGYDNSPKRRQVEQPKKGEPVAEALVQQRDQVLHSVKILKANDDVESIPVEEVSQERRKSNKLEKYRKKDKGIYSQDFRVLKILPSNLDDFNDIEEIGDEIYFRTDENKDSKDVFPSALVPTALTLASEVNSEKVSILPIPLSTLGYSNNLETNDRFPANGNRDFDLSKFENITIIIREGEEYFVPFPKPILFDNITAKEPTTTTSPFLAATTTTATSTVLSSSSISTLESSKPPLPPQSMPPSSLVATTISAMNPPTTTDGILAAGASHMTFAESATDNNGLYLYSGTPSSKHPEEIEMSNEQDIETPLPTVGELTIQTPSRQYTTVSNEWDDSLYDNVGNDGNKNVGDDDEDNDESSESGYHAGIQRTYYGPPKPQGFTMTPGYPKFYIGECECKWKILAPISQKIRLTILDISLRTEKSCRDYLEIFDSKSRKSLFKGCDEPNWPVEIISSSNEVEIVVKATTKFAYPKRGVLIHYSEEDAVSSRGIVSGSNFELHKTESATGAKMGFAEADTVLDIIVPSILIVALFAVNAIIFVIIMKQRKRSSHRMDTEAKELAEL
ncbi:uncharacterized protein LOC119650983 isoform X2 [Hermetia illucens]|uniref:uncharacterized protein LOC119650983 isoform X2 n=1 Tax=Hermetia illucens TaxID=343691 RepID=UPI0018CC1700|nr:uncharacterized protein LOC119650983 isoform X2 [Hermetia illucens]